ncbi:MAG TPA: right-handed parallel beta-helix repeat-containing protein, partial [Beijerinckiaceae bacterium]
MTSHRLGFRFALLVCGALLGAPAAQAQATRTWVSGVGNDIDPCSRTAPCKTFAGAMSKTAANGEIDVLDPGGFGAVTITKSMTIDGTTGQGFGSILANGGINGVVINVAGGTVRLRNLSINGTGGAGVAGLNGIKILAAASVHIENVVIANFSNRGISDERTAAGKLFITDTIVRNNAGSGVVLLAGGVVTAMLDRVISENNGNAGFSVSNGAKVTARNATSAGNL